MKKQIKKKRNWKTTNMAHWMKRKRKKKQKE